MTLHQVRKLERTLASVSAEGAARHRDLVACSEAGHLRALRRRAAEASSVRRANRRADHFAVAPEQAAVAVAQDEKAFLSGYALSASSRYGAVSTTARLKKVHVLPHAPKKKYDSSSDGAGAAPET